MQLHLVGGFLGSGKTTAIAAACKVSGKSQTNRRGDYQ